MKEIYRDREYTKVGYHQSILEAAGIPTLVKSDDWACMSYGAGSEMIPTLCVMRDEDHDHALEILREHAKHTELAPERPLKGIYVLAVVVLFGMPALMSLISMLSPSETGGSLGDEMAQYLWTTAVFLGCSWVVWVNVQRFVRDRQHA